MAKQFAKRFYNSSSWIKTSKAYAASVFNLCEICGKPGYIVHHIIHLTPQNINDPNITLSWHNLKYVCITCHNKIHSKQDTRIVQFDADGNVINVNDTPRNCV